MAAFQPPDDDRLSPGGRTRAESERLIELLQEANERLVVVAVRSQDLSEDVRREATDAAMEVARLTRELRDANDRTIEAAEQAKLMADNARRHEAQYSRLSSRLLQLQDEERRRFALDLHDSTAQRLAALMMNLDVIGKDQGVLGPRSREALAAGRSLAEQCIREVRTLAYLLHPPGLDEAGLVPAVRWYAEGFSKRSGIRVTMAADDIGRLPRAIETALFRIVQESLTNVHRHTSTTAASIHLTNTGESVVLDVRDEGRGLQSAGDPDSFPPEALGVGIQGMRERVRQLGGVLEVTFAETGTTVHASVPVDAP